MPRSLWHDNDPLDVILLTTHPLLPGVLVRARPIALMNMIDGGEGDDKIIAVPVDDPRFEKFQDLGDINPHTVKEIEHFYSTYKKLQDKEVEVKGFQGKKEAQVAFEEGLELYTKQNSLFFFFSFFFIKFWWGLLPLFFFNNYFIFLKKFI